MAERYKVVDGSQSAHCCFDATVVDTTRPVMIGGKHYENQYEEVCECFDRDDAQRIAAALNAADGVPADLRDAAKALHSAANAALGVGMPAADYLAKVEADPMRAAALQRARDRAGVPAAPSPQGPKHDEADCKLCTGKGFYGSPGTWCSFCKGTGKVMVFDRKPAPGVDSVDGRKHG